MTDAELRGLLLDCLKLWDVPGRIEVRETDLVIATLDGDFTVSRAPEDLRPVRWFYLTPERAAANALPRAAPSIVALLSALRNAMAGEGGDWVRISGTTFS